LAAIYQCIPQTLERQDQLLHMLAEPPNSKVCLMLIECLSSLMESRGRLEDWRWDSEAVRRARRVSSHLTKALVYLKQNGTRAEFERALQLCIDSCLFRITAPTPHSTSPSEDSGVQTLLHKVYREHSQGGAPAELFTAEVMTALLLHGVLPIPGQFQVVGAVGLDRERCWSTTQKLISSAEGLSWEAHAKQRAAGRRSYARCRYTSMEAQRMCAEDVAQSMTRLLQLISLAARSSKFTWQAPGDAKTGPNDAASSIPVEPARERARARASESESERAGGSDDNEEERQQQNVAAAAATFRDAAALILEGTRLLDSKGVPEFEAEVGAVERCVFGFVREYCSWYGLIDPQAEDRVKERERPTVGDRVLETDYSGAEMTGVVIQDSRIDDDITVEWDAFGSVSKPTFRSRIKVLCKARPTQQVSLSVKAIVTSSKGNSD